MRLLVDVLLDENAATRPAMATPVFVQLQDTSMADVKARVLTQARGQVTLPTGPLLATVELPEVPPGDPRADLSVWVRCDGSNKPHTSPGDWISTARTPVRLDPGLTEARVRVRVRPVGGERSV